MFVVTSAVCTIGIEITPLNNTLGIYYHNENIIKISNDNFKLLVYKNISLIIDAFTNNKLIFEHIKDMLFKRDEQYILFEQEIMPNIHLLSRMIDTIDLKIQEIQMDTKPYFLRQKRGLINGLGSVWKAITGNLDASDGEYYEASINKLEKDENEMKNLLKNQILVTTTTIKNFNYTIQKLQLD